MSFACFVNFIHSCSVTFRLYGLSTLLINIFFYHNLCFSIDLLLKMAYFGFDLKWVLLVLLILFILVVVWLLDYMCYQLCLLINIFYHNLCFLIDHLLKILFLWLSSKHGFQTTLAVSFFTLFMVSYGPCTFIIGSTMFMSLKVPFLFICLFIWIFVIIFVFFITFVKDVIFIISYKYKCVMLVFILF